VPGRVCGGEAKSRERVKRRGKKERNLAEGLMAAVGEARRSWGFIKEEGGHRGTCSKRSRKRWLGDG